MGLGPIGDLSVDWTLLFDVHGDQSAQRAKPIDGRLVGSLISLPQAITGEVGDHAYASLAARDLQRGQALGLPSGENVARLIGAEVLGEEELGLSAHGWTAETPLWLYIQREAAARHAGDRLGEVGGTITAEVLIGVIGRDPESYWAAPPFPDSFICVISCYELPVQVLVVGLLRSPVAECRVETLPIITDLNVPRNILPSDFPRRVRGPVDALDLHRGVE